MKDDNIVFIHINIYNYLLKCVYYVIFVISIKKWHENNYKY